jgi:transposase
LLSFETPAEEVVMQEEEINQQITYTRKKQSVHKCHPALPTHLPVREVEIYPEGDLSEIICIGKEVSEEDSHSTVPVLWCLVS